jgi:hypothetical protein
MLTSSDVSYSDFKEDPKNLRFPMILHGLAEEFKFCLSKSKEQSFLDKTHPIRTIIVVIHLVQFVPNGTNYRIKFPRMMRTTGTINV